MFKHILSIVAIFLVNTGITQTLNVYVNDSIYIATSIKYTSTDSSEGVVSAKYADYPNHLAFSVNYYNKYRTGFVKYYYPSGKLMMTQVFQKSKKNGEYTLYDENGEIVVKGNYVNNVKDGFWAYRKYKFMGNYSKGLKNGKWKFTSPNLKKQTYRYKKGVLVQGKIPVSLPEIPKYILRDGIAIPKK